MVSWLQKYTKKSSQKFKNHTLQTIFHPFYILLTLMGLFPYSVKFQRSKREYKILTYSLYRNSVSAASFLLICCAFFATHVRHLFYGTEVTSVADAVLTQFNYILELLTLLIFCFVVYICTYLNRFKYVKMINGITSAWNDMPNRHNEVILGKLKFRVSLALALLLVVFILQHIVNCTRSDSVWKMVLVTLSFILPQMIQFICVAFYYVLIMMVVAVLSNIKENALYFIDEKTFYDGLIKVKTKFPAISIRQLELIYMKALNIKEDINKAFEAPILVTTVQSFHAIVSESYIMYHGVITKIITTHEIFNCFIWIVYQVMKIYILAYSGSRLNVETVEIGRTLHSIPIEKQDLRMLMEIQHFSTLMSYHSSQVTVYGYFNLDATLLFKMIASTTMYVIILVQFDRNR